MKHLAHGDTKRWARHEAGHPRHLGPRDCGQPTRGCPPPIEVWLEPVPTWARPQADGVSYNANVNRQPILDISRTSLNRNNAGPTHVEQKR